MSPRNQSLFCLEALEERRVLAGIVTALFAGNKLTLTGDAASNDITITQGAANQLVVTGNGGTMIRVGNTDFAAQTFTFASAADKQLSVVMAAGDDVVTLGDGGTQVTLSKLLKFEGNGGADTMTLNNVLVSSTGVTKFNTGTAATDLEGDSLTLTTVTLGGSLQIDTGLGIDTVNLTTVETQGNGPNKINTGSTDADGDILTILDSTFGPAVPPIPRALVQVDTGGGNDTITMTDVQMRGLAVKTGAGADTVTLNRVTTSQRTGSDTITTYKAATEADIDGVTINGSTFCRALTIKTGAGNDAVTVQKDGATSTFILDSLIVDTGAGDDNVLIRQQTGIATAALGSGKGHGTLTAKLGDGLDTFTGLDSRVNNNTASKVSLIDAGNDIDTVTLTNFVFRNKLDIKLGEDANTLTATTVSAEASASITGGSDVDNVTLTTFATPKLTAKLGDGADIWHADGLALDLALSQAMTSFLFDLGKGSDTSVCNNVRIVTETINLGKDGSANSLTSTNIFVTKENITGGDGVDTLNVTMSTIQEVVLKLLAGDDDLTISNTLNVTNKLTVDYGPGTDTVHLNGFIPPLVFSQTNGPEVVV